MTIWKGGPINNIDELGAGGNIICIGPSDSIEKFLEQSTGKKYFDKEVYSEPYSSGWEDCSGDDIVDEDNDIHRIQVALAWFSKLIPASALNLRLDFPYCDFEIICEFNERELSYWLNVRNYKKIPSIAELLKQGKLDGHETMLGFLRFGKSFPKHIHEELWFSLDPDTIDRIKINQKIEIVNNTIDTKKSFFLSE